MALRFTQRDFLGLREEMIRFMSEKLGDKWNDYSESDETITLIELLAHCVSNLHFAYDNQKRETDIVTASFPRNIYAHAIRNGYKPSLFKAGRTWINIDFRKKINGKVTEEYSTLPVSVIIPRYTEIKNNDGDICITNREFVLPAGASHFSIEVFGGQYAYEQFTRSDINDFDYIVLGRLNISSGSTRLFYQNEEWTPVTDVFTDVRSSKIYSLEPNFVRQGVRNIIRFFTNWKDEITDTSKITLEYIQTNGARSNYEKDTFTSYLTKGDYSDNTVSFNEDIYDSSGNKLTSWTDLDVSFTQSKPFENGQNYESVDVIKKSYLQSIRQTTSLVVLEDYEAFLTLNGINNFYVTDWDRNKIETITIEYPRDIKALKAEPDDEGHSIFSPLNTTTTPYWQNNVSNINSSDKVTETRKIDGREIIIFKSFDVNIDDFIEYENEHWYKEWKQDTQIKNGLDSKRSIKSTVFLDSPFKQENKYEIKNIDGLDVEVPIYLGNYDTNIAFMDVRSRERAILNDLIDVEPKELRIRVTVTKKNNPEIPYGVNPEEIDSYPKNINIKYSDLTDPEILKVYEQLDYDRLFKSFYLKNSHSAILFDVPPAYFDEIDATSTNIADVSFKLKNDIYTDGFLNDLKLIYSNFEEDFIDKETIIKSSISNKIKSLSIKVEGIEYPFIVPSEVLYDTFLIIDGFDKTIDSNGKEIDFKHGLTSDTQDIYSSIGYYSKQNYNIEHYLEVPINEEATTEEERYKDINDRYGMPVLLLSNDHNNEKIKMNSQIGLCFRKKTLDLHPLYGTTLGINNISFNGNECFYEGTEIFLEFEEQNNELGVLSWASIPVLGNATFDYVENTTAYQLRRITPLVYIKDGSSLDRKYYEPSKNAYKVFYSDENNNIPVVTAYEKLYHDDFFFDEKQLTAKPLNLNYIITILNQESTLFNDESNYLYLEEYTASNCIGYDYDKSESEPKPFKPNDELNQKDKYGFVRTATHLVGRHKYDYASKPQDVPNDNCLTNLEQKQKHILNSIFIEIQTTFPKYLKYLILQICFVYEANYNDSHETLNKYLVELGIDNIRYALNKILTASYEISYWYKDEESKLGKQYTYSPNENKRFIACGGDSSWDEELSPASNYFRWDIVYPEIVDLYKKIQQKQGRGDAVFILPYIRNGLDIHAHVFIESKISDISSVFENIWNAIVNFVGILTNIEDVHYVSEFISVIQSADSSILKVCTVGEIDYNGKYVVSQPDSTESMYITDTSESSLSQNDFYKFLEFIPTDEVEPESDLGHSLVLGNVCIRIQKNSILDNTVYHFERNGMNLGTTLAYKLKQVR